MELNGKINLI